MLDKIFKMQVDLSKNIWKTRELGDFWERLERGETTETERAEWLSKFCTALMHEVAEVEDDTNWKWWKTPTPINTPHLQEELIDVFHFWVAAAIISGMTPEMILKEYERKWKINLERQANGY